ncbi:kanamycin kinase [Amycolatopsis sp. WAC 01416]|uniref:ROK family protein n=1 Tax=Amycolatopsis sp. WAC 01416 TaxID=2203196 RepID=UPI000F7A3D49|nr:ROK family protein [Amycolatopsis sp. WAC 01416]RSN35594.1 kanamycin kinase [Amycolatopsis sp. WAC 01416]
MPTGVGAGTAVTSTWLGIDFGGTKVALRTETDGGEVREHVFPWRGRGLESDLTQLAAEIARFRLRIPGGYAGIGVALPATVGTDGLVAAWPNRPEWIGLDLRRTFRSVFGDAPLRWADDGDLGALAEARALGCPDLLYVGVGTGIGGGLVAGDTLVPGPERGSFELGHVVTDPQGRLCGCGRRGCLQAGASGPATLARATRLRGTPVGQAELRDGLLADEEWAVQAVDRTCHLLAVAITGVRELLHPGTVILGGGFAAGVPGFADRVARHVAALARPGVPAPVVRASQLGPLSTLHGAVALARLLGSAPLWRAVR